MLSGCVTTETPSPKASAEGNGDVGSVQDKTAIRIVDETITGPSLGSLTESEEKFAKALAHFMSAEIHRERAESNEAMEEWEAVVKLDPSRSDLREQITRELFRRNDFKKAAEMIEVAVQQDPKSASNWTALAVAYRADKQWEKAMEAAENALRIDASKFLPFEVLFEVAVEQKDVRKAKKVLERAADGKSDDFHFWIRLAELHQALRTRDPSLGIEMKDVVVFYDRAIELQPNDSSLLMKVADYYAVNQEIAKSISIYEGILAQQPYMENIRLKLALAYVSKGDRPKAISLLEEIIKTEPYRYQVFNMIAELYEDLKNADKALTYYRNSLQCNEKQLPPRLEIVLIYTRQKKMDEALKELADAAEKFPNAPQISYFYGLVYCETKEFARAVQSMEEALKVGQLSNPDMINAVFYYHYGAALERNGDFDKAVVQFKKAMEMNPDYADAYNYLGFMYADKNIKLDEAAQLLEKALAYEPENSAFLDSMGWLCYRQGKFDKAADYIQRALKGMGGDSIIYDHLADVYLKMGRKDDALMNLQKAVELDPRNKEVMEKLDGLRKSLSSSSPASPPSAASTPAPEGAH